MSCFMRWFPYCGLVTSGKFDKIAANSLVDDAVGNVELSEDSWVTIP